MDVLHICSAYRRLILPEVARLVHEKEYCLICKSLRMFFPEKITLLKPTWKVLEIGPGSTPHPRANVFLELHYRDEEIKLRQRGGMKTTPDFGSRPVHYYEGGEFPFSTNEFAYVICSHVLEHVPELREEDISSTRSYLMSIYTILTSI